MTQLHVHTQEFTTLVPTDASLKEEAIEKFFTHLETHGCKVKAHHLSPKGGKLCLTVEAQVYEFH